MGLSTINIVGQKFGFLKPIEKILVKSANEACFICLCDCGKITKPIRSSCLRKQQVKSCGCKTKEMIGIKNTKHGKSKTKEYNIWNYIKKRCFCETNYKYKDYGGRGITVCDRWLEKFENFLEDMGKCPENKNSIDRIDNNGDYCPENCRWADNFEQANNTRKNKYIEYKDKIQTISQWSRELNIPYSSLYRWLNNNISLDTILNG